MISGEGNGDLYNHAGKNLSPIYSMAHCVNDYVNPDFVGRQTVFYRISRIVDPFPRVTEIAVEGDECDQPSVLVFNTPVVGNDATFL